jgi:hypothetical protein
MGERIAMPDHSFDVASLYPRDAPADPAPARAGGWRSMLVGLAAGAVIGVVFAAAGFVVGRHVASMPWFIAGLVLGLWPNVVLHELGHLLTGMAAGMRPIALGIGPFRYERTLAGWRGYRGGTQQGIAGFAALLPHGDAGGGRGAQALMLAGGPLANLLIALACFFTVTRTDGSSGMGSLLLGVGGIALVMGAANLLPFTVASGWRSDGRNLLDLARRALDADLYLALQRVVGLSLAGQRPREWPANALPAATHDLPPTMLATSAHMLCLSQAMDAGDVDASYSHARWLADHWTATPPGQRPAIATQMGAYAAIVARDAALLAAWRPRCEGGLLDLSPYRAWLDAELALLRDDPALPALASQARSLLSRVHDAGSARVLEDHVDRLQRGQIPASH